MPTIAHESLRRLTRDILEAVETPPDLAAFVADALVGANLAGHDSHGVLRLPFYVEAARNDRVQPTARATVTSRSGATARIDGAWGWGHPAMQLATETAVELAREFGLGSAVVNRSFHIGRVAPYVEHITRAGMIGIAMSNAGPAVAPYGGRDRVLGTNPFAWAVPRGDDEEPISFDAATSAVAEGKLRVARAKGLPIAPGIVVDVDGRPSIDPHDFYAGGALLTFGAHKGYGISLLAQMIGRGLAGLDPSAYGGPRGVNGPFVLAIDIARFVPVEQFTDAVGKQCADIAGSQPGEGFDEVLLPGDLELRSREERLRDGIPVADQTWAELTQVAAELNVAIDPAGVSYGRS